MTDQVWEKRKESRMPKFLARCREHRKREDLGIGGESRILSWMS